MFTRKNLFLLCALFLLLLSACAQTTPIPSSSPTPAEIPPTEAVTNTPTPLPPSETPTAQETQVPIKFLPVVEKLAQSYGLNPDDVRLLPGGLSPGHRLPGGHHPGVSSHFRDP